MNRYAAAIRNRLARIFLPGTYARMQQELQEKHKREFQTKAALWNNEVFRIISKIIAECGVYVRSGPFKGMMFWPVGVQGYWAGGLSSSLLGLYELELHPAIEDLVKGSYEKVINFGCADGYYAVGLARRLPSTRVFAFDIDPKARHLCEAMATINGVADRIEVDGECTIEHLRKLTGRGALVVCDCEGAEVELLRPDLAPGLADSDILVELHDILREGVSEQVLPRFAATHDIEIIETVSRDPAKFPELTFLTLAERSQALDERRPGPMRWAVMRARSSR